MRFQVGDIVEFNYDCAENAKAKRIILLLKPLSRERWKCELMHDSTGNYSLTEDRIFYLEKEARAKLLWRAKTGLDNVTAP
jgi:hypothetical protein